MQATDWEFKNRAMIFGMIFGLTFPLYFLDPQNVSAAIAIGLGAAFHSDPERIVRWLFVCAALWLVAAALVRTWASSYLRATVVYAGDVKADSLVADGPYRRVRNPLYFANVLLAVGMGAMMSRVGFAVAVAAMVVFCFRLILREEADLKAAQGERYERYVEAVPRLWPSVLPRIASAGQRPNWGAGFKAELWYWGFPAAVLAFAVSLDLRVFYSVLALGVASLVLGSWLAQRKGS